MILCIPVAKVMVALQQFRTNLIDLLIATALDPSHLPHWTLRRLYIKLKLPVTCVA